MIDRENYLLEMVRELKSLNDTTNKLVQEITDEFETILSKNRELENELVWYKRYTDALVEHKDMACLPADLKNLRNANAQLTADNESLNRRINLLNEKLSLMKSPITEIKPMGDEKNMTFCYLNPEKHIGGGNSQKETGFNADELVDNVKKYDDSLKNKN